MKKLDDNYLFSPGMLIEDTESYVRTLHLVDCPKCKGTGNEPEGVSSAWIDCQACDGKGKVLMRESEFKVWEEK